jgi:hypothetical protein
MKKIVFCLLFFIGAFKTYSQGKGFFSTEIDANYYYYCSLGESTNKFNYGFSILISKYINRLKVSSGLNYSTKSYYYDVTPIASRNYLNKRDYKATYLNFPIVANIEIFSQRKFCSSILTGFMFNQIVYYNIKSYYLNGETLTENILLDNRRLGVSFIFGTTFSKLVGNKCQLNLSPFINYKLLSDHDNQRPDYKNIPDDKISIGFRIGIEYFFKTTEDE